MADHDKLRPQRPRRLPKGERLSAHLPVIEKGFDLIDGLLIANECLAVLLIPVPR